MGWSTDLFCNITFNKETYNYLYEVENRIEDLQKCIAVCKEELRDLAIMTEPNKFFDSEENDSIYGAVSQRVTDNLEILEEYIVELYKLYLLKDNWKECHNEEGLAIAPPDNIKWDSAFLDGDFVKSDKHPNGYE